MRCVRQAVLIFAAVILSFAARAADQPAPLEKVTIAQFGSVVLPFFICRFTRRWKKVSLKNTASMSI